MEKETMPKSSATPVLPTAPGSKTDAPRRRAADRAAADGSHPLRRASDQAAGERVDEGHTLARTDAVRYLHSRRQAMFALSRQYHLDAEDMQQEAYEVLLTCLRDFTPKHTRADGSVVNVQFNTFFGNRLEGKALEMRNRDPEYQARQAHLQDLTDEEKEQFRNDPPLLVQHLDQETTLQEHLRGEVAMAARRNRTSVGQRILQDSFIEKKLNELIAAERDDKRRAALMHVKVGGVASFEEIAYHFGVTDSRASQILNDLMDAFYVQRLLDGDLKSVAYDFRKLKMQDKRALRLLEEALRHALPPRASEIVSIFNATMFEGNNAAQLQLQQHHSTYNGGRGSQIASRTAAAQEGNVQNGMSDAEAQAAIPGQASTTGGAATFQNGSSLLTPQECEQYPLQGVEQRDVSGLTGLTIRFRPRSEPHPSQGVPEAELPHIARLVALPSDHWPLLITDKGQVIDGQRRLTAALKRGLTSLQCQVIAVPDEHTATLLRVALNLRAIRADKPDLYWAIAALLERGMSQQKISQLLGTSRPNVIVYAKVREKASTDLRRLFEDGLIQITNASTAVDLPETAQQELAAFVRRFGADWGRGPRFNELYDAARRGNISMLAEQHAPRPGTEQVTTAHGHLIDMLPLPAGSGSSQVTGAPEQALAPIAVASNPAVDRLRRRQQVLETSLRDAETWSRQREAALAQQTQQIIDLKAQIESLNRELGAAQLLPHGDAATLQAYLKEMREFNALTERLAGATHQIERAARQVRALPLKQRQVVEVEELIDRLFSHINGLRTELVNRRRTPTG